MLFNSWQYVILVVGLLPLYYLARREWMQVGLLILGSFAFYAYGQPYLLALLLFSASLNAVISYRVARSNLYAAHLAWACLGVGINLAVLGFFKYAGFLAMSVERFADMGFQPGYWLLNIPLPVGISFYTFQGISLVMDLLRKDPQIRERDFHLHETAAFPAHFMRTIFFICFFPQLVAGPILKAHQFYPQIHWKSFSGAKWQKAIRCLILGYFLKMGIADNLNAQTFWIAYPYFLNYSTIDLFILLLGFSWQIFADFAGYSLIAIGTAALFGYNLPANFNFPYIAVSFSDFWRRWHISLSSWLRDYLYIPLGGNRKGEIRTYFNLFIVMFLGGLWHGAAWSYAVWGTWHGLALAFERPWRTLGARFSNSPIWSVFSMAFIFLFVTFSWLLFQLPNFSEALLYLKAMATNTDLALNHPRNLVILLYGFPVILYHFNGWMREQGYRISAGLQDFAYGGMLFWILFNSGSSKAFIYFQF